VRKEGSQEIAARELFVFTIEELEGQSRRHSWDLCTEALRSDGEGENGERREKPWPVWNGMAAGFLWLQK
jgi:hypothetical protein